MGAQLELDLAPELAVEGAEHFVARPDGPGQGNLDYWQDQLLRLEPGPSYVNGVAVRREPSGDGGWFLVRRWDESPEGYDERLRVEDAAARILSADMPWVTARPPKAVRVCSSCKEARRDTWMGAFFWCVERMAFLCSDCRNDHACGAAYGLR